MGHEDEKLVRDKVKEVEQMAVPWNKTGTWDKINNGAVPKKRKSILYYAAASLLVGVACVIYLLQLYYQDERNIVSEEPAIVKQPSQDQLIVNEHKTAEKENSFLYKDNQSIKVDEQTITKVQSDAMKTFVEDIEVNKQRSENELNGDLPYADLRLAMDIHDSTKQEKIPSRQRIEPIIGVIPQQPPISVAKEKRLRVRILKQPAEGAPEWQPKDNIFTARIN